MLPQNIINQKIYLVLWFWFVFLAIVGSLQILFEIIIISLPIVRNRLITWNMGQYATPNVHRFLRSKCGVSDWFVLYQIGKNTDKHFFCKLLGNIADRVGPSNIKEQ